MLVTGKILLHKNLKNICLISFCLTIFLEDPTSDKLKGSEDSTLLLEGGGVGGHGAWRDASDVCMVAPAGYKEHRAAHAFPKHLGRKKESSEETKRGRHDAERVS